MKAYIVHLKYMAGSRFDDWSDVKPFASREGATRQLLQWYHETLDEFLGCYKEDDLDLNLDERTGRFEIFDMGFNDFCECSIKEMEIEP